MIRILRFLIGCWLGLIGAAVADAGQNVYLTDTPDYSWSFGCFGTATGNLMGYWDRHGFPDFYTGPTAGGVAPLDSNGANAGIQSLWASQGGVDGRPWNQPGHVDDYYLAYESTAPDPYVTAKRAEHAPDCLGDFTGLNQNKWTNMNNECNGNIDGYSFVYWDPSGDKRINYVPGPEAGLPEVDLASGLRAWTQYRGEAAEVFTQLSDFNPTHPAGKGFRFEDLQAEIDAGYPVLLFMQNYRQNSRDLWGRPRVNPNIHGMLAYGYLIGDDGKRYVRFRTSWASGDTQFNVWTAQDWLPEAGLDLPLRGVIGYHPLPKILRAERTESGLWLQWRGPQSELYDVQMAAGRPVHGYVVEKSEGLNPAHFEPASPPMTELEYLLTSSETGSAFFRVSLVAPPPSP